MSIVTEHPYIIRDSEILSGEPIIKGTRTSVRTIVENWRQGLSPEEITQHLPHLTLAQVFDALSYFSDHQQEILHHIERNRIPDEKIDPLVKDPMTSLFIRLYLDEDVSVVIASIVHARGYEVLTTRENGQLGAADQRQLAFAAECVRWRL